MRQKILEFPDYEIDADGTIYTFKNTPASRKNKVLKPRLDKDGYFMVNLYKKDIKTHGFTRRINRLLAITFKPLESYEGMVVRHMDGNPQNNNLNNLEWGTFKQNEADKKRHGTWAHGEKIGNSKLKEDQIIFIKKALKLKISQYKLAEMFNVSQSLISEIKRGTC